MDPGLNSLLQWGIKNSGSGRPEGEAAQGNAEEQSIDSRGLNEEALRALMGGPSQAELMKQAMETIYSPDSNHQAKMTAFDNFEQLVESIDNANNMEPLGLWTPLVALLQSESADLRRMASWCVGTAVQNNVRSQERFLAMNGIPKLCKMITEDEDKQVRRKAVYALSSEIRNYQPGLNEAIGYLPSDIVGTGNIAAEDMEVIDSMMAKLRDRI